MPLDRLDGPAQGALPLPHRSDLLTTPGLGEREAYTVVATPPLGRSQLPVTHPSFGQYSETPRTAFSSMHHGLTAYQAQMASTSPYSTSQNESHNFPWPELECVLELTCEGQSVTPDIHAKVEKGFFQAYNDRKWTCYRRNYFSVACHFELFPNISNGRMYLKRNNAQEQIQAMGIRLSAAVDGTNGKTIELVQHTPKRDQGPKTKIEITKLSPYAPTGRNDHSVSPRGVYQVPMGTFHATGNAPGPYLPLQSSSDDDSSPSSSQQTPHVPSNYGGYGSAASQLQVPGHNTSHTFERVQFKSATANNGKRRASQQYFHLIVELFADVRKEGADRPVWVKVAQRTSEKIVVRGRSPSHYQNEGQNGQTGRGNAGGGSSYSGAPNHAYHSMNPGGFRSSTAGYGNGLGGGTGYRSHYGMAHNSDGSGSSPGSVDEGAADPDHHGGDALMSDAERANIQQNDEYQYFPAPIYEGVPHILPPLAKVDSSSRYSTEPRQYAVKAEYADAVPGAQWTVNGCSRFQGKDT